MGNSIDPIPLASQVKSAVQAAQGDLSGAEQTQQNFIRQTPVVSQITYAVQAGMGDADAAEETRRQYDQHKPKYVEHVPDLGSVDSVPIVSQVKSAVQAAKGDLSGAEQTQQNFIRQCPVFAQVTSAVQAGMVDMKAAEATQLQFVDKLPETVSALSSASSSACGLIAASCGEPATTVAARAKLTMNLVAFLVEQAHQSHCDRIASTTGQDQCFLAGTFLKADEAHGAGPEWISVADLSVGSSVLSAIGEFVKVKAFIAHPPRREDLVRLAISDGYLTVTNSHRIMVRRHGGQTMAILARDLASDDEVWCTRDGDRQIATVTDVTTYTDTVETFQITFEPDLEVLAFSVPIAIIHSKGHKNPTRRGTRHMAGFPDTDDGF